MLKTLFTQLLESNILLVYDYYTDDEATYLYTLSYQVELFKYNVCKYAQEENIELIEEASILGIIDSSPLTITSIYDLKFI